MSLALKGNSREAFAAAGKSLESSLAGSSAVQATQLSQELFLVIKTLDTALSLRRALTDPSHSGEEKSALAANLFAKKISEKSSSLIGSLVSAKWSAPGDLVAVVEFLAVTAEAFAAEQEQQLDQLEEDLFRFSRVISANPQLRAFLAPSGSISVEDSAENKVALVNLLLTGKAASSSIRLISQIVAHPRGRSIEKGLLEFAQAVSDRKNSVIAYVKTAQTLSSVQLEKLTQSLSRQVGQSVRINVEIDPALLGGVSIRFADELIDGSLSTRLAQAGRELAS